MAASAVSLESVTDQRQAIDLAYSDLTWILESEAAPYLREVGNDLRMGRLPFDWKNYSHDALVKRLQREAEIKALSAAYAELFETLSSEQASYLHEFVGKILAGEKEFPWTDYSEAHLKNWLRLSAKRVGHSDALRLDNRTSGLAAVGNETEIKPINSGDNDFEEKLEDRTELMYLAEVLESECSDNERRVTLWMASHGQDRRDDLGEERVGYRECAEALDLAYKTVRVAAASAQKKLGYHIPRARSGERCLEFLGLIENYRSGLGMKARGRLFAHMWRCKGCDSYAQARGISKTRALLPFPALIGLLDQLRGVGETTTKAGGATGAAATGSATALSIGGGKLAALGCVGLLCAGGVGLGIKSTTDNSPNSKPREVRKKQPANVALVSDTLEGVERELSKAIRSQRPPRPTKHKQLAESEQAGVNPTPDPSEAFVDDADPPVADAAVPAPDPSTAFADDADPPVADDAVPAPDPSVAFGDDAKGGP